MKLDKITRLQLIDKIQNFVKEQTLALIAEPHWAGAYMLLPETFLDKQLAVTVRWEEGFGSELRDDCIQVPFDPDWALCVAICWYNPWDTPDMWDYPYDPNDESGEILTQSTSLNPSELDDDARMNILAKWLVDEYEAVISYSPTK